jgi:mannose-1-phosphate guanylyltransferase
MRTPKQLLNITGGETMLRETVARLLPVFAERNCWVVTNSEQASAVRRELPRVPASHILAEPVGRNTAAAIALAAIHLAHQHGDALMAVLSSDAHIANVKKYRSLLRVALQHASAPGHLVVFGVPPTRPETGYGYIERGLRVAAKSSSEIFTVRRFTEKPEAALARRYVASGKYFWNAGMFFWRVSTFLELLRRFLPATHAALAELAKTIGTPRCASALQKIYPQLDNISVDYAIVEPASKSRQPSSPTSNSTSSSVSFSASASSATAAWASKSVSAARSASVPASASTPAYLSASGSRAASASKSVPAANSASVAASASAPAHLSASASSAAAARRKRAGVDFAEPSVSVIPAEIGWSDIGTWNAVYELLAKPGANFSASPAFALDATGNFFWSPKKFVAALGVHDLVLVETSDAILLCPRNRSQDVSKIVKWLEQQKLKPLL